MFKEIFDLSQPVYENCPAWPTYEMTGVKLEAFYEKDRFTAERINLNSHTGTHIDAPYHFYPDGVTIDKMPVDLFQGDAVLADLRGKIKAREGIGPEHLSGYDSAVKPGSIVIFNTGWGKKRGFSDEYLRDWPYLSGEGAEWLLSRRIKGVGIDCVSMGGWYEGTGRLCHETLLPANIWILEDLLIPDALCAYETFYLMAFPLKLRGFSGAPARAVAAIL